MAGHLAFGEEPDLRDPMAFDFVISQLNDLAREVGARKARLGRDIMVDRAAAAKIDRHNVEVAITLMVLSDQLVEENGVLSVKSVQGGERPLPSVGLTQRSPRLHSKALRTRVMPHVEDVIARRKDGRPRNAEPLGAFAERLEDLGYGHFRLWWNQTAGELGRTDPNSSPLSAIVLAAALVEGVLTFVVTHARRLNRGVFGSKDFEREPKMWRIDDLVAGAARGADAAILDAQAKNRADGLVRTRQRIHAGRMLVEFPHGVPDLRPEEAREAKAIAEQVVRSVLDWLSKYPPS